MSDLVLPLKFVHMVSMAVMFGTWLGIAMFMLFAHRYGKAPVMALISVIVVRAELWVMLPAVVLQPLVGFPLAFAVRSSATAYWLEVSAAHLRGCGVALAHRPSHRDAHTQGEQGRRVSRGAAAGVLPASVLDLEPVHRRGSCRHDRHHGVHDLAAAMVVSSFPIIHLASLTRRGRSKSTPCRPIAAAIAHC